MTQDISPVRYSDEDLAEFKEIIDKKLDGAKKEITYLNGLIGPEDPAKKPDKAELEQFEQMVKRQQSFIDNLEKALERIADKTYGICRTTGHLIDKKRLLAVPHATLSVEAKTAANIQSPAPPAAKKKTSAGKKKAVAPPAERKCRVCGCTEDNCAQCIKLTGEPCHWVEEDLCSACEVVKEKNDNDSAVEEKMEESSAAEEVVFYQLEAVDEPATFFSIIHNMINGLDINLELHRIGDLLQVSVIPQTQTSIKPFKIKGTPAEIDAEFFKILTGPLKDLENMKIDLAAEARKSTAPAPVPVKKEKIENPRNASKKIAAKKLDKQQAGAKKSITKPKPVAPDMFANIS